jgi:ATP-dependent DNA helicase RecQ
MKESIVLDTTFIKKRKQIYESKLNAVKEYITESDTCRTRVLVRYFGEQLNDDCGICDVCISKKKLPVSNAEFHKIVADVENVVALGPLTLAELGEKLPFEKAEILKVIDFLLEAGKIERGTGATIRWLK